MISVTHTPRANMQNSVKQERTELNITKRLERILKLTSGCFRVIIKLNGGTEPQTLSAFSGHQR